MTHMLRVRAPLFVCLLRILLCGASDKVEECPTCLSTFLMIIDEVVQLNRKTISALPVQSPYY